MQTRIIFPSDKSQPSFTLVKFDESEFEVNAKNLLMNGGPNCHENKLFAIYGPIGNFSHCYGIFWAANTYDALKIAANSGLLDSLRLSKKGTERAYANGEYEDYLSLGDAGELFDVQDLTIQEIPADVWKKDFDFVYALGRAAENSDIERWKDL